MALDRPRPNVHRIGRMRFRVGGGDERALLDLRSRLARAAERDLPEALQAALDQTAGADESVEIARLEVDLGRLEAGASPVEAIATATAAALSVATGGLPRAGPARGPAAEEGDPSAGARETALRRRRLPAAALSAYLLYLETGDLPPSSPSRRTRVLLEQLIAEDCAGDEIVALISRQAAAGRSHAAIRLIATTPSALVVEWLAAARPDALAVLGGGDTLVDRLAVVRTTSDAIDTEARRILAALAPSADAAAAEAPHDAALVEPAPPEPDVAPTDAEEAALGVPVPNAGVVLLHPFFPALFERCALIDGRSFKDTSARIAAAHLVGYLATGRQAQDEAELAMARALVALEPETPSPPFGPIERAHAEEADNLLRSAIDHWTKLGTTSIEGLREGFLTRPGILYCGPPPSTAVEQRGVDVLLGHLPWALTPVRLPWLEEPIKVDWR